MQKFTSTILATALLIPIQSQAASITADLSFSASDDLFINGGGFNESANLDVGIAVVDFGARASTGDVNADVDARITASYKSKFKLNDAGAAAVNISASNVRSAFDTFVGATAGVGVDFDPININMPFPVPDIDINPGRIALAEVGYGIETSGARNGFGAVSDTGNEPITGFGIPTVPLISTQAEITLDGSQQSTLDVDDIFGIVQATHESGKVVTDAFSIINDSVGLMNLDLTGTWDLELVGIGIANTFDSALGLAASARIGFAAGVNCGDFTTDADNGFGCIFDTGSRATSPQLTLIDPSPFGLDFGLKNVNLGAVDVVPLPAGLGLMLSGLGVMGFAARRKRKA